MSLRSSTHYMPCLIRSFIKRHTAVFFGTITCKLLALDLCMSDKFYKNPKRRSNDVILCDLLNI